jgi:hypothetical protein
MTTSQLAPGESPGAKASDDATGLPWPTSWPGVYACVLACFVTWVALLVAFELFFS